MANTQPARFRFSVKDGLGTRASISVPALLDPAMTITQLVAAWGVHAQALDAIIDGQILDEPGVEVQDTATQFAALGLKSAPLSTSRVEQTGVFDLTNASTPSIFGVAVASLSDSVISAGRILIPEDGVVDVWLDILEEVGSATLPQYTNAARQALVALFDAFISFRKRRKQLTRSSRESGPD